MRKTVKTFEEGTWEPSKSIHPEGIGVDPCGTQVKTPPEADFLATV